MRIEVILIISLFFSSFVSMMAVKERDTEMLRVLHKLEKHMETDNEKHTK